MLQYTVTVLVASPWCRVGIHHPYYCTFNNNITGYSIVNIDAQKVKGKA